MYLLVIILEIPDLVEAIIYPEYKVTMNMLLASLSDKNNDVRVRGLHCLSLLLTTDLNDEQVQDIIKILPSIIEVMKFCIEDVDHRVSFGFELLYTLVEDYMDYLQHLITDLLKFMLEIGLNSNLEYQNRQQALYFVETTIAVKPKSFLKSMLLLDVIKLCFILMTEQEDDPEEAVSKYGSQIIDVIALEIPNQYVWEPIMEKVVQHMQSTSPIHRKAAITAITVISEGYFPFLFLFHSS